MTHPSDTIHILTPNPYRQDTQGYANYELYHTGMTRDQYEKEYKKHNISLRRASKLLWHDENVKKCIKVEKK